LRHNPSRVAGTEKAGAFFQREMQTMRVRRVLLWAAVAPILGGCSVPFVSHGDKKSECDRMSAEAIQTSNLGKARELAAGASACYAKLTQ